ncbi:MAG: 50S ribosome-binding GTPase [Phycisphaeraceae bacterium]|nr:50S ribosome-binding GTPase [Phycisphaerales bacterium]MCB9861586.1 50S ribosome-binding GTPase [Phycisphaeraceae bacterium]
MSNNAAPNTETRSLAPWQQRAASSIHAIADAANQSTIVRPTHVQQQLLDDAIERARGTLLGSPEPVLLVAIVGPSGAGKSSLINALAGDTIAKASPIRPTTRELTVYHHESVVQGSLPADLIDRAHFVKHTREELRNKVLIDTPDIDTFVKSNRELTQDVLKAVGLTLCVVSPERYLEERLWSVLNTEIVQDAVVFVINKRDLCTDDELAQIQRDIAHHLAQIDLHDIPMLSAISASESDIAQDTSAVSNMLTNTLSASDAAVLARQSRVRAVESVTLAVQQITENVNQLSQLHQSIGDATSITTDSLLDRCSPAIEETARAMRPDLVAANHAHFWGPMRAWFGMWDGLTIGLPRMLARVGPALSTATQCRLTSTNDVAPVASSVPLVLRRDDIADTLEHMTSQTDQMLAQTTPQLTPLSKVVHIDSDAANTIIAETASHSVSSNGSVWKRSIGWVLSFISMIGTIGLLGLAVYYLGKEVWQGTFGGINMLAHMLLFWFALHVVVHLLTSLLMPTSWKRLAYSMKQRFSASIRQRIETHWHTYEQTAKNENAHLQQYVADLQSAVRSAGIETHSQQH